MKPSFVVSGLLAFALGCGSGGGGGGGDGGGGDGAGGGSSYSINFSSTGAITGTWAWDSSLNLNCAGNLFDVSLMNTGPDAGASHASLTMSGDGSFTFRTSSLSGGVKGKASGGSKVSGDYKQADWNVTFSNTTATDMMGNTVTLNGSITARCIL